MKIVKYIFAIILTYLCFFASDLNNIIYFTYHSECNNTLKRNKYLLLDDRITEIKLNAKLEVGKVKKYAGNPLFVEDKPWEKRFDNLYGNVIYDEEEGIYKCWYSPFIIDYSSKGMTLEEREAKTYIKPPNREMAICYAISKDGITWQKPVLGLVGYEGSTANNIIWRGPHGAGIFKDAYETNPLKLYKAIFRGLFVSFSKDGLKWGDAIPVKDVKVKGDTHNNAFWAPTIEKYVGITRTWGSRGREVARIESSDFIKWTKEKVILKGKNRTLQTYSMPVFFYGGVYLGLVSIYNKKNGRVWTELAWSPDTIKWERVDEGAPLIPNSKIKLSYDYGCVYACANPIILKDEIRLYYSGSDWLHSSWRNGSFNLATLRPDGFAGYVQKSSGRPAIVVTAPIQYNGKDIFINADIKKGGFIQIDLFDNNGNILFTKKILKTMINENIHCSKKIKIDTVQIRFKFINAKIYSFWFSKN
jgi:hypothetical protein